MARIVVTSAAYLGDVAPFVEPANRLADRGHDVTFVAPAGFHDLLAGERFSLATYPVDFSARAMHADPVHQRLMRHPFLNQARLGRYWVRASLGADAAAAGDALAEAVSGADAVVSHATFASLTAPVAAAAGVPLVVGQLFPMMMPTAAWTPPLRVRNRNLGPRANRWAWRALAEASGRLMCDRELNEVRRAQGAAPLRGAALLSWTAATRTVVLLSRHYAGADPGDWDGVTWGGFARWDGPSARPPDPAVDAYVAAGDAPVLVCLGTSAATGASRAFARIADDLARDGLRSLLLVGDAANLPGLDGREGAFEFAPVTRVLPSCRVAVVSGALGTLAAALAAGVPVVVLPQLFDQPWHGARAEDLGVGVMVRRPRQVAAAVARIEADPSYRERARDLAARLATEDGAGALADAVESVL